MSPASYQTAPPRPGILAARGKPGQHESAARRREGTRRNCCARRREAAHRTKLRADRRAHDPHQVARRVKLGNRDGRGDRAHEAARICGVAAERGHQRLHHR